MVIFISDHEHVLEVWVRRRARSLADRTQSPLVGKWDPQANKLTRQPKRLRGHFREGFVSTRFSSYPLRDFEFAVLDVETSGLKKRDRVVEIAVLRMSASGRVISEFTSLINPGGVQVSEGASYVNDITDDHLAAAPPLSAVWATVAAHLSGAIVVAHNAPFDVALLHRDLKDHGPASHPYPTLDLLYACRTLMTARTYALKMLLKDLRGEWPEGLHVAQADVRAEAEVLRTLLDHPKPLYWHGPRPEAQDYVGPTNPPSPAARNVLPRPAEIPSMAAGIGREILPPPFVAPEVSVRNTIRRTRYFAGNDSEQTRSIIRRLVRNGGVEAKRLTPTTKFFIGEVHDLPAGGLPEGVQLVDVPGMEGYLAREETATKSRESEFLNHLRERHNKKYADMRYYALGWREKALSPKRYIKKFGYKRWNM